MQQGCRTCFVGGDSSDSCSSLQVLFNLSCVLPIEPLCLLIELGISLVDVVDVCIVIVRTSSTVFFTLFNSVRQAAVFEDLWVNPVDLITQSYFMSHTLLFYLCIYLLFFKIGNHSINPFLRWHVSSMEKTVGCGIKRFTTRQE